MSFADELKLNDYSRTFSYNTLYRPVSAFICGVFHVNVIVEATQIVQSESNEPWHKERDYNPMQEVVIQYTVESLRFTTNMSNIRPDRPLQIGFKQWMAMPELRANYHHVDFDVNFPTIDKEQDHGSEPS